MQPLMRTTYNGCLSNAQLLLWESALSSVGNGVKMLFIYKAKW